MSHQSSKSSSNEATQRQKDDLLIVVASFEAKRCLEGVKSLPPDYTTRCSLIFSFDVKTSEEGEVWKNRASGQLFANLEALCVESEPIRVRGLSSIDTNGLIRAIRSALVDCGLQDGPLRATIDASCFPRVQLTAAVRYFVRRPQGVHLRLLYTLPKRWGGSATLRGSLTRGVRRPMTVNIGGGFAHKSYDRQKGVRLAIVLLGQEGGRTLRAWHVSDADLTWIVDVADASLEMKKSIRAQNGPLIRQIERGTRVKQLFFSHLDLQGVFEVVKVELSALTAERRPVVCIVPFGPKPFFLGVLLAVSSIPDLDAEVIYPQARYYEENYSSGVELVKSYYVSISPPGGIRVHTEYDIT